MTIFRTPLKFIHVGFNHMVCANQVVAVVPPGSSMAKRMLKEAKDTGNFIDMTSGKITKSLIVLDNGRILSCALSTKAIVHRLNSENTDIDAGNTL